MSNDPGDSCPCPDCCEDCAAAIAMPPDPDMPDSLSAWIDLEEFVIGTYPRTHLMDRAVHADHLRAVLPYYQRWADTSTGPGGPTVTI